MTFLPKEIINDPKALHNVFVEMKTAYDIEKVPMTKEQSEYFIKIAMMKDEQLSGLYKDLSKTFPIGAFLNRITVFPIKFDERSALTLGVICSEYGVGGLILIGYYLEWLAAQEGRDSITYDWVFMEVFPWGIFSQDTVHKFWDKQKVKARPDNLVDHPTVATSFLKQEMERTV